VQVRQPPTETEVRGADWYGEDLSGQEHGRVAFIGVDLSRHSDAAFLNCTFSSCSFFQAEFTECKLVGSTFDRCAFDPALTGVRLREADLVGVRAVGAILRHLDLSVAELHQADLSGADLRGSHLSAVDPRAVGLAGAQVDVTQAVVLVTALGLNVRPDAPDEAAQRNTDQEAPREF
jgi:fluoroquinolone resistance protein